MIAEKRKLYFFFPHNSSGLRITAYCQDRMPIASAHIK